MHQVGTSSFVTCTSESMMTIHPYTDSVSVAKGVLTGLKKTTIQVAIGLSSTARLERT